MKIKTKNLLLTLAAIAFFGISNAQKIAHLRLDSLINLMPETKAANDAAIKYLDGLKQELGQMQTEMDGKYKDFLQKEPTMSELIKKSKQADLQQLQNRIQEFQSQAEIDFKRRQNELTLPIMAKAKKGIAAAAKDGGYKYVLDTSIQSTNVLYNEPTDDILAAVKKKLDAMPMAMLPGVNAPATPLPPSNNQPPQGGGR